MAEMLKVTSCCGCYSLRTGVVIIGILQIIISIMMLILTYALNIRWDEVLSSVDPDTANTIFIITSCITIFIATLLLVGVFQRNTCMMLPWFVLGVIGTVSGLINTISTVIESMVNNDPRGCVAALVGGLISLAIQTYLLRVVYSHFQELKNDKMDNYPQQA